MIDLILVITIISSPIILTGAIVLCADIAAAKRHKKWINDFKKRLNYDTSK